MSPLGSVSSEDITLAPHTLAFGDLPWEVFSPWNGLLDQCIFTLTPEISQVNTKEIPVLLRLIQLLRQTTTHSELGLLTTITVGFEARVSTHMHRVCSDTAPLLYDFCCNPS